MPPCNGSTITRPSIRGFSLAWRPEARWLFKSPETSMRCRIGSCASWPLRPSGAAGSLRGKCANGTIAKWSFTTTCWPPPPRACTFGSPSISTSCRMRRPSSSGTGAPDLTQPALPTKYQLTAPLQNGVATFNSAIATAQGMPMAGLPIANYTFTARYNGDTAYTYANSSASAPVSVAISVPTVVIEPTINASPLNTPPTSPAQLEPYTLPCTSGPPGNCTTSYSWGQPASNPPGYLVVAANGCIGCVGSWGSDGTVPLWAYNYPLTVASASGDLIVGTAAYAGQTSPSGYNLGSVNYGGTSGSLCGSVANSASIIDVYQTNNVDVAPFPVDCAPIIGINGAVVPVFMAYFTFTPQYSDDGGAINRNHRSVDADD